MRSKKAKSSHLQTGVFFADGT